MHEKRNRDKVQESFLKNGTFILKSASALVSPDKRWSWTILEVEFILPFLRKLPAGNGAVGSHFGSAG